jgi:hypothetical protein
MIKRSPLLLVALGLMVGLVIFFTLGVSGGSVKNRVQDLFGYGGEHSDDPVHGRDLFHSGADVSGTKGGLTYAAFDTGRDLQATESFFGFGCVETCDGPRAGFKWASSHRIADPADCQGLRWDFIEGCVAYAIARKERQ